ncbi:MAG: AmmeMemoRadiSam system radical SAM enzyme [Acidobacteriota bacterium]
MKKSGRRKFIKNLSSCALLASINPKFLKSLFPEDLFLNSSSELSYVEAKFYKKLPDNEVKCEICPRECVVGDKERGYCGVRENKKGKYYILVYGRPCALNVDPIEKKPFFHFLPGTEAFSIATAGCNVNCKFCQNWQISQVRPEQIRSFDVSPEEIVKYAKRYGAPSISYTYSEPIIFYEYMYDVSLIAWRNGIRNTVVTGGHINPEPLLELTKVVDAIKVDLKAFHEKFFKEIVRGELKPVLETIKLIKKSGKWLEIVYLVIPTLNDSPEDIRKMSQWLVKEVGNDVPIHFSRFYPMYLMKNLPPTPISTLEKLRDITIKEGVKYVYIGNVPGHEGEKTFCEKCGQIIVDRFGYTIRNINIKNGKCKFCLSKIPGVWNI